MSVDNVKKIDLHMHTIISDGTDSPEEILGKVKKAGINVFAITDHDAIRSSTIVPDLLKEGDPKFLCGVEFSCKDDLGKYHILGYGYDPHTDGIQWVVDLGHSYRIKKVKSRFEFLTKEFGFVFPQEELDKIYALENPGKPHIGNLMTQLGFAESKEDAIKNYINKIHFKSEYVKPEEAIKGILASGGIPVLAHPVYGSGDQLILGEDMEKRLIHLMDYGLKGVEAFYSGFTKRMTENMLEFAKKYGLYTTAGSDYHGKNKMIELGDTGFFGSDEIVEHAHKFLEAIEPKLYEYSAK